MDPHLLDLRYFLAVAEELSVTRAAERVFVSQPALSKRIRRAGARPRRRAAARGHRAIALTAAGEALRPRARAIVEAWDAALLELRAAAGEEAGEIVVGLHTAVGRGLYARAAPALAERHPGVRGHAAGGGLGRPDRRPRRRRRPTWRSSGCRCPTRRASRPASSLAEPRLVAMPAGNPLADAGRLTMDDLLDEPFVALPPEAGPAARLLARRRPSAAAASRWSPPSPPAPTRPSR